jgi:hypothetical protein
MSPLSQPLLARTVIHAIQSLPEGYIGGDTFLRNVGSHTDYTTVYPIRGQHSQPELFFANANICVFHYSPVKVNTRCSLHLQRVPVMKGTQGTTEWRCPLPILSSVSFSVRKIRVNVEFHIPATVISASAHGYLPSRNKFSIKCRLLGCDAMWLLLELMIRRNVSPQHQGGKNQRAGNSVNRN